MCANEDGKEKMGASLPSPARSLSGLVTSPSRFSLAFVPNEASKQDPVLWHRHDSPYYFLIPGTCSGQTGDCIILKLNEQIYPVKTDR